MAAFLLHPPGIIDVSHLAQWHESQAGLCIHVARCLDFSSKPEIHILFKVILLKNCQAKQNRALGWIQLWSTRLSLSTDGYQVVVLTKVFSRVPLSLPTLSALQWPKQFRDFP